MAAINLGKLVKASWPTGPSSAMDGQTSSDKEQRSKRQNPRSKSWLALLSSDRSPSAAGYANPQASRDAHSTADGS